MITFSLTTDFVALPPDMHGDIFKDLGAGVDQIKEKLPGKCDIKIDRDTSQHTVTVRLNDDMTLEFIYNGIIRITSTQ